MNHKYKPSAEKDLQRSHLALALDMALLVAEVKKVATSLARIEAKLLGEETTKQEDAKHERQG